MDVNGRYSLVTNGPDQRQYVTAPSGANGLTGRIQASSVRADQARRTDPSLRALPRRMADSARVT